MLSLGENSTSSGAPAPQLRLSACPLSLSSHQQRLIELLLCARHRSRHRGCSREADSPCCHGACIQEGGGRPPKSEQLREKRIQSGTAGSRALGWRVTPADGGWGGGRSGKFLTFSASVSSSVKWAHDSPSS